LLRHLPKENTVKKSPILFAAAMAFALAGCATIVEGSKQTIRLDTKPSGAICAVQREGAHLHSEVETPAVLTIEKDRDPLVVTCRKEGFEDAVVHTDSSFQEWTLGNLVFGGIIGLGVDAASGALNEYPAVVVIPLTKKE
jgi:hypothetical protein